MNIYEVKTYTDEEGHQLTAKQNTESGTVTFEGTVGIPTPMGIQPFSFDFPEGTNIEECFTMFEETANIAFTEAREEHERKKAEKELEDSKKIITPAEAGIAPNALLQFPK